MSTQNVPQPVQEFRIGGTITASVWRNETQQGGRTLSNHSVQIQKRYYDKADGAWKTSSSYFPDDLPRLELAVRNAYEWIMTQPRGETEEDNDNGRVSP